MSAHSNATPRPWVAHKQWPAYIIPASDAEKRLGGSVDADHDRNVYATIIARANHDERGFAHDTTKAQAAANAALIVRAVNAHEALVEALKDGIEALAFCERAGMKINPPSLDKMRAALSLATRGDTP